MFWIISLYTTYMYYLCKVKTFIPDIQINALYLTHFTPFLSIGIDACPRSKKTNQITESLFLFF